MSIPHIPQPAKLVISVLFSPDIDLALPLRELEKKFGEIDFISPLLPFHWTTYYEAEMGSNLFRKFVSFSKLQPRDQLAQVKLSTNTIEERYMHEAGARSTLTLDF